MTDPLGLPEGWFQVAQGSGSDESNVKSEDPHEDDLEVPEEDFYQKAMDFPPRPSPIEPNPYLEGIANMFHAVDVYADFTPPQYLEKSQP